MPRYIVKIEGLYAEWSTIPDAPYSTLMTLDDFNQHYREEHGRDGMERLPERMDRVEATGCSTNWGGDELEYLIYSNRCGEWIKGWTGRLKLTVNQIVRVYKEDGNGHPHNFDKQTNGAPK